MTTPFPEPPPKPDAFLALLQPKVQTSAPSLPVPLPFRRTFETAEYRGEVGFSERDALTASADGATFVVVGGTVVRPERADSGAAILALYAEHGADFVHTLNGQYALLLVDERANQILFVTDRSNTVRLLFSEVSGTLAVSNTIEAHPLSGRVDSAGVASYLMAGFCYGSRTVFEGVRGLDGGSIYRPRGLALVQQRYWRYQPTSAPETPARTAELKRALEDAMVDGTRVHLRSGHPNYVSLSAGFDSRGVLGILAERLHAPDLHSFTYTHGAIEPMTDEACSPPLAAQEGVPHELIDGFHGSVRTMIEQIARWGMGIADVCDELDAWRMLRQRTASGPRPVLFSGDLTLISADSQLSSVADVVSAARMPDFTAMRWIEPLIGAARYHQWVNVTRAEIDAVMANYPAGIDLYQLRDMARFEGYDGKTARWREYYAGRVFDVANPMMDDRVVDVFMRTPTAIRRRKILYHETLNGMFPALYALPRARVATYANYWQDAYARQADAVSAWIREQSSPFDDVLPPDVLVALVGSDLGAYGRHYTHFRQTLKKAFHWLRGMTGITPSFARPSLARPIIPAHRVLTRALVLRTVFQNIAVSAAEDRKRNH